MRSPMGSPACCAVRSLSSLRIKPCPNTGPVRFGERLWKQHQRHGAANARPTTRKAGSDSRAACRARPLQPWAIRSSVPSLNALHGQRDALPHADAHGRQRELSAELLQLMRRRHHQPRAAHAQGMAEGDRSAGRIHVLGIVGQTELAKAGERLAGESLVELDPIEVADASCRAAPAVSASPAPGPCPSRAAARRHVAMPRMRARGRRPCRALLPPRRRSSPLRRR